MKLRYYIKEGKKTYTLKESVKNEPTKSGHYKFIRIQSVKENVGAQDSE